ncbi:MAG: hypothetical protein ACI9QD_001043 [Thermoproteota archaeon]|jgi:hypothetical protein
MMMYFDPAYEEAILPLEIGDKTTNIVLPSSSGNIFNLDDVLLNGPVLVNFIKGTWYPFCR